MLLVHLVPTSTSASLTTSTSTLGNSSPISASPTAASSTDTTIANPQIAITNSDNLSTITLHKGEEFSVQFGDGLKWSIAFDPSTIVSPVQGVAVAVGEQGVYTAAEVGTTTLRATGAPVCAPHQACPMFLEVNTVTIKVTQ